MQLSNVLQMATLNQPKCKIWKLIICGRSIHYSFVADGQPIVKHRLLFLQQPEMMAMEDYHCESLTLTPLVDTAVMPAISMAR